MKSAYDRAFYERQAQGSLESARVVVPLVLGMIPVRSVVDFGCGLGAWLRAFVENGVDDIRGYDGDHVDRSSLMIPTDRFVPANLAVSIETGRSFDLAISLEVAEHLPSTSARGLVLSLTSAAPVVLFSSAIPGQKGVGHVNCRWQRYWAKLFYERGFDRYDPIRPRIVDDARVENWYRSNTYIYVRRGFDVSRAVKRPWRPDVRMSRLHGVLIDFVPARSALRAWIATVLGRRLG